MATGRASGGCGGHGSGDGGGDGGGCDVAVEGEAEVAEVAGGSVVSVAACWGEGTGVGVGAGLGAGADTIAASGVPPF